MGRGGFYIIKRENLHKTKLSQEITRDVRRPVESKKRTEKLGAARNRAMREVLVYPSWGVPKGFGSKIGVGVGQDNCQSND